MEHSYWEEKLQGYVDNELGPADLIAMESHVEDCPECSANFKYFQSLKKRLRAHADTICIPQAVEDRIQEQFSRKNHPQRRNQFVTWGLAMAAALMVGFLLPKLWNTPYRFVDEVVPGEIVCHDCEVADRAGLKRGTLCGDGHRMGLVTEKGALYRIAQDKDSLAYSLDKTLVGKQVRVYGQTLEPARMIRIKSLEQVIVQQAALK